MKLSHSTKTIRSLKYRVLLIPISKHVDVIKYKNFDEHAIVIQKRDGVIFNSYKVLILQFTHNTIRL